MGISGSNLQKKGCFILYLILPNSQERVYYNIYNFMNMINEKQPMQSIEPIFSNIKDMAGFLRLIGNPLRLQILFFLLKEPRCVCELAEKLEQKQPCISQHLMLLRKMSLVDSHHDGWKRSYYISSEKLKHCLEYMQTSWLSVGETDISSKRKNGD